jgi:ABC-type uncharacterized transport system substrate-binding protein
MGDFPSNAETSAIHRCLSGKAPVNKPCLSLLCLVAGLSLPAAAAWAHPHVFITAKVAVDLGADSVARISIEWTFDELFSQMIIEDYDRAGKGSFTDAEAAALRKGAFDNLRNYHYFLAAGIDRKPIPLPPIRDFRPSIRDGRLVYSFSIAVPIRLPPEGATLSLIVYDDTYYVAFDKMEAAGITVRTDPAMESSVSIEKAKIKAEWPGQFMPDMIVIRFRSK